MTRLLDSFEMTKLNSFMTKRHWTLIAFLFLFIGICLSLYLVVHHYELIYGMRETKSFCSVSEHVDCDAVNASSFSEIWGIPVAMFAAFSFAVQILILLGYRAFDEQEKVKLARFFFYLSSLGILFSIYLGSASAFVLKTWCLFCISLYIVCLVSFLCGWKILEKPVRLPLWDDFLSLFRSGVHRGSRGLLVLLLVIPLGSAMAHGMYTQNISKDLGKLVDNAIADWQQNPKQEFNTEGSPTLGNPNGRFEIVEFSDFQCPHCKRAAPSLHAFMSAHRDNVKFVFQNYPLDKSCNPKGGMHDQACLMARASLCAMKQNKFTEAHDWIFAHQESLDDKSPGVLVQEIGLEKSAFDACIAGEEVKNMVTKSLQLGEKAGLEGTPTIFANGRLLPLGFLIPVLEKAYSLSK